MSLHPLVLADLLADEADVARERLGDRVESITVRDGAVHARFTAHGRTWWLRLDGRDYDRLPLSVSFTDEAGDPVGAEQWPPGVEFGSPHPVLHKPWVCLRGTLEWHTYMGHAADGWDAIRAEYRVADVISHVLERCGR